MVFLNIALNKPASASGCVLPFSASKAVNGNITPTSRWLCNSVSTTNPAKLTVSLNGLYIITSWVVRHMGVAGWASPNYNMSDYKLQGSVDNATWYDIDSVAGNTSPITTRNLTSTTTFRYVRLYVSKGLNTNPQLASAVEFEVYGYTTPFLSSLVVSAGSSCLTMNPTFAPTTYTYALSAPVPYATSAVNINAVPQDSNATVKVNGTAVAYSANIPVPLSVGANTITVEVSGSDGQMKQMYTVAITRASAPMVSLVLKYTDGNIIPITPTFDQNQLSYTANVGNSITGIFVTATSGDSTANVTVNGQTVSSGQAVTINNLNVGPNTVTAAVVGDTKSYTVTVTRAEANLYLSKIDFAFAGRSYTSNQSINPDHSNTNYTVNTSTKAATVTFTPVTEDTSDTITVNNNLTVGSGQTTSAITLNGTSMSIPVKVTKSGVSTSRDYTITITRS